MRAALRADIAFFIERHNAAPKPFRSADDIRASIERRYNVLAKQDPMTQTSGSGH